MVEEVQAFSEFSVKPELQERQLLFEGPLQVKHEGSHEPHTFLSESK
jgi:hypothetical protein